MNSAPPNRYIGTPLRDPLIVDLWIRLSKEQRAACLDLHRSLMSAVTLGDIANARQALPHAEPEFVALPARFRVPANLNACPCCSTGKGLHNCYGPGVARGSR